MDYLHMENMSILCIHRSFLLLVSSDLVLQGRIPYEDNHQLEIYRIDIEPGGKYNSGSHGEKTREYLSVTDGELTIECGEDVQKITKGEIYRFETDKKHNYKNETQQKTSFICVFVDYR